MLPETIKNDFIEKYFQLTGERINIQSVTSILGGSINFAFKITTNCGNFFLKWNNADAYPDMFATEAKGLKMLFETNSIVVPRVIMQETCEKFDYLVLNYIEQGTADKYFWNSFGKNLASLHRITNNYFGLDYDNYIGSLKQYNGKYTQWIEFFIEQRLEIQIKLAKDKGLCESTDVKHFYALFNRLEDIFPDEKPSLIHGDLWSGNYMVTQNGEPCIIDPAIYFGSREMDIAMSKLFGGFSKEFYSSYNYYFPLEKGWEERIDICNLYPLMVHVNLFGNAYLSQVRRFINKF
ncbi:MAG TPA: fructosamine kinase family protein [Bacteroidales bacterium]|nr:fructosamine kinase family protein [Bacteroidales bacterium]